MQEKPEKCLSGKIEAERFELYKVKEFSKEKREVEMFELEKETLKAQTKN